jgi:DNA-binding response OmpR family regulator
VTAPVSTPHAPPIAGSGSHVLVVDDDPRICTAYVEILSAHGYEVTVAKSRAETLVQLDRVGGEIDVLVLDLTLPDAEGAELARVISDQIGTRPALFVTGWADEFWDLSAAPGRWLVMQKPIPVRRLIEGIEWLAGRRTRPPG